jgi:hypothetical protein
MILSHSDMLKRSNVIRNFFFKNKAVKAVGFPPPPPSCLEASLYASFEKNTLDFSCFYTASKSRWS